LTRKKKGKRKRNREHKKRREKQGLVEKGEKRRDGRVHGREEEKGKGLRHKKNKEKKNLEGGPVHCPLVNRGSPDPNK